MRFVARFWSRFRKSVRAAFIALLVVVLVFTITGLEASLVILVPEQCSGGWQQADYAMRVSTTGPGSQFSRETSAWLPADRTGVLTCGGFVPEATNEILQEVPSELSIVVYARADFPDTEIEEQSEPEPVTVDEAGVVEIGEDIVEEVVDEEVTKENSGDEPASDESVITIDPDGQLVVDDSGNVVSSPVDILEYAEHTSEQDVTKEASVPEEESVPVAEPEEAPLQPREAVSEGVEEPMATEDQPESGLDMSEGQNADSVSSAELEISQEEDTGDLESGESLEDADSTEESGTATGEPTSWLPQLRFMRASVAHAQESAMGAGEESVENTEILLEDTGENIFSDVPVGHDFTGEPTLEVFYTINKEEFLVGAIPASSKKDRFTFSFTLPAGVSWNNIQDSSITVRPVVSFDVAPVWFVDALQLQFEEETEVFTYEIGAGEHFAFDNSDFISIETESPDQPGGLSVRLDMNAFLQATGVAGNTPSGPLLPGDLFQEVTSSIGAEQIQELLEAGPVAPQDGFESEVVDTEVPEETVSSVGVRIEADTDALAPQSGPVLPSVPGVLPIEEVPPVETIETPQGPELPREDQQDLIGRFDDWVDSLVTQSRYYWKEQDAVLAIHQVDALTGVRHRRVPKRKPARVQAAGTLDPQVYAVTVYDTAGNVVFQSAEVSVTADEVVLEVPEFRDLPPGEYSVVFEMELLNRFYTFTETIVYGVLTLNTDQSTYLSGEEAYLQMAALDESGHTLCYAPLELIIQSPSAEITTFSVLEETIKRSGECGADNVTDVPDYQAWFTFSESGTYTLYLRNSDTGDYIERRVNVLDTYEYRVQRTGATRINPFESTYTMRLHLEAAQPVSQGTVFVERVPKDFVVTATDADRVVIHGNKKLLVWDPNVTGYDYMYTYQAPLLSPFVFTLGEAYLVSDFEESTEQVVYREQRTWQLASDAVGDLTVRREATGGDAPDANGDRMEYDTSIVAGSDITYNAAQGLFRFDATDKWLVIYNEAITSTGTADEGEIEGVIEVESTQLNTSRDTCYIPRVGGADECWISGAAIVAATALDRGTIAAYRRDGGSATLARNANTGGLTILRLDDTWDYVRLRENTGGQTVNSTSFADITWDTQDEYDSTSFTHSTSTSAGEITLNNVGHYLVVASVGFESTTTGDRAQQMRITLDDVEIAGAHSTVFIPSDGSSASQIHSASYMGVVETTSSDQVLAVEAKCSGDTCGNVDIAANYSGISIVKLPSGVDFIRLSDSNDQAVDGTADTIEWDTEDEKDTGSFGHSTSTNTSRIEIDHTSGTQNYLFFASFLADRGASTDTDPLYPVWEWRRDGSTTYQYGSFGSYNNGANGSYTARASGGAGGVALTGLANTSYIELINTEQTTGTDSNANFQADSFAVQGINLTTLFAGNAFTEQNHFRWRTTNPSLTLNSTTFGAAEDTNLASPVAKGDDLRLRFEVANTGGSTESSARTYEIEYGVKSTTCAAIGTWTDISTGNAFQMVDDANFTNGDSTSAVLDNTEGYSFTAGDGLDTSDTSGSIGALTAGQYTEIEYSFEATTQAGNGTTYCFRLYDATNTTELDGYSLYPELEIESAGASLTFEITDVAIGFGQLSSSAARYATGDETGTGTETFATRVRVTTNASSGYSIDMQGVTLTNQYGDTITAIGGTSAASSPGTEQFGIRAAVETGSGIVSSPYNHASNYAYAATSVFDQLASNSTGTGVLEGYNVYFLANIDELTEAGSYSTDLQFRATATF